MKAIKIQILKVMQVKDIKNAIWFIKESKKFTGYGYLRMLFKENLISKTIRFCKEVKDY